MTVRLLHLLVGLNLIAALLLASCVRPPATHPPQSEPIGADTLPPNNTRASLAPVKLHLFPSDSGSTPQQVVRRRLFGLLPAKKVDSSPQKLPKVTAIGSSTPRKCKGCTFNMVAGNQTNQHVDKKGQLLGDGASVKGDTKAKGGAVVSQDSSVTNAVTQGGNLAAATGEGSQVTQTVPPPEPKLTGWQKFKAGLTITWSAVKWPLTVVTGVVGVGAAICALAPTSAVGVWLLALVKRKESSSTQVNNV